MNESPKVRFQKNEALCQSHRELVLAPGFEYFMDVALSQMLDEQPRSSPDLATASANHFRIEGARAYINVFMRLSEPYSKQTPARGDHLPN